MTELEVQSLRDAVMFARTQGEAPTLRDALIASYIETRLGIGQLRADLERLDARLKKIGPLLDSL